MTPKSLELMEAVSVGDLGRVRSLVESGADVNATDEHGSGTLLNFHPGITAYLLSKGANPNTQTNENGVAVLAGLCFVNQAECAKLLLAHGADVNRGRDESKELAGGADIEVIRLFDRSWRGCERQDLARDLQLQFLRERRRSRSIGGCTASGACVESTDVRGSKSLMTNLVAKPTSSLPSGSARAVTPKADKDVTYFVLKKVQK